MTISIPLHQDPRHSLSLMANLPATFKRQLRERAQLAFTMVNLADMAGRKSRSLTYPKDAVFGGFTTRFVQSRIHAAYPKTETPPELTDKQKDRLEENERYRDAVLSQVSLTNYEQNQYMLARRRNKGVDPRSFIGCRAYLRG